MPVVSVSVSVCVAQSSEAASHAQLPASDLIACADLDASCVAADNVLTLVCRASDARVPPGEDVLKGCRTVLPLLRAARDKYSALAKQLAVSEVCYILPCAQLAAST